MKTIDITITPEDFKNAQYVDSYDCPLARAVRRTLNVKEDFIVGVDVINVAIRDKDGRRIKDFKNNGFNILKFREVEEIFKKDPNATYVTTITEI